MQRILPAFVLVLRNIIPLINNKLTLVLVLLILSITTTSAFKFKHISTADGLNSSIIRLITQDSNDFMWIGTYKGLYKFDGYNLTQLLMPNGVPFNEARSVKEDRNGTVWIATKSDGLFYFRDGQIKEFSTVNNQDHGQFQVMIRTNQNILLVYSKTIIQIDGLSVISELKNPINDSINSVIQFDAKYLMIGTQEKVHLFNITNSEIYSLSIESPNVNRKQHVLHKDRSNSIWLGRSDGLYEFNQSCMCFVNRHDIIKNKEIYTLDSDEENLWIGTNQYGLFRFSYKTKNIKQYSYDKNKPFGILDSSIISIYVSQEELWIGTFNNGVNYVNKNTDYFGSEFSFDFPQGCLNSQVTYDIYEENESLLWFGSDQGITRVDINAGQCDQLIHEPNNPQSLSGNFIYSFFRNGDELWVTGSNGIDVVNLIDNSVKLLDEQFPKIGTYFINRLVDNIYLIGTNQGLLSYDADTSEIETVKGVDGTELKFSFYLNYKNDEESFYFGTNHGLYQLVDNSLQKHPLVLNDGTEVVEISGLSGDGAGGLLMSANEKYLLRVDGNYQIENLSSLLGIEGFNVTILEIIQGAQGQFWMSSDNGIYQLDLKEKISHNFKHSDGLQSDDFLKISSHKGKSGKMYFGGRQGFNAFYPEDIVINEKPPKVVITEISQLNIPLSLGQETLGGYILDKPINEMESIELGYKDLSIGLEFAALDYADAMRNQYAYRLLGFNNDWSYVDADNRTANYTNLNPGKYTFQVKAANKDGIWNETPKQLAIKVYPAPWFSLWAYAAYIFILLLSIWCYIRFKTVASSKRAEQLEVTVTERTQEVVLQKKMVESLLDHKNEVFANVTHEFKTPLALILGPVDEMVKQPELGKYSSQLNMVQRNAKRLLLMVGQILKLSQAEQDKEVIRESQAVKPTLLMLYESFFPLARDKGLTLTLSNAYDVNVYATAECIETVVGNLISNAVKYTSKGGTINIEASVDDEQVTVSVKDNGPGIKAQDFDKIFKRFIRLDNHKSIQGTGIGLSVVKEVTEANNGYVNVKSEWGKGAEFSVTFPITQLTVDGELSRLMTDQLVSNVATEVLESDRKTTVTSNNHPTTVLIIEDNLDMQQHTGNILHRYFNCIFADRGEQGIAMALHEVPDIIICDVMMPGMDGYQVTRILRHDERTSHIPIILLTALNTKESRIKGWREKIDRYMTKPFDGTELIVQLESMLSIRKLLQQKTNQAMHNQGPLNSLDLSKQDLKFIEKLQDVIVQYYSNEYFQKADLADKMAVSERQLQRKIKALIGIGPLDMLRDFRLDQAKLKLKEGFQVGLVSDECGFGSVSYFGTCFKKRFGMTPKQYQQL